MSTSSGKSTLIETLAMQDLAANRGFALVDPHGDLVERVWAHAPAPLRHQISYLNAPDSKQPFGYNPLRRVRDDKIPLAASGLVETEGPLASRSAKCVGWCPRPDSNQHIITDNRF